MTNLLITTDNKGNIHYFNQAEAENIGLNQESVDKDISTFFKGSLDKKILQEILSAADSHKEILESSISAMKGIPFIPSISSTS